jgi:hypothetical protein
MKTAPITVPRVITPVAAQATSIQTRTSVPATAPRMDTSLETIGQTMTMTGATTVNLSMLVTTVAQYVGLTAVLDGVGAVLGHMGLA